MRVFAISDIHVDYEENAQWIRGVSSLDYRDDVLILAGDVSHRLSSLAACLSTLAARFKRVLFVPGNHDLWVLVDPGSKSSLQKFGEVAAAVEASGASMQPFRERDVLIVPLLGWYDYTFGAPTRQLMELWMDYQACRWPVGMGPSEVAVHFTEMNHPARACRAAKIITFSHFLPRLDLRPEFVPPAHRYLDPVLGSTLLEGQLRELNSSIHVYGHSHINRSVRIDGIIYVNNAFGYPREARIAARRLVCIHEI
jgi:predicted phosphodiesterase